MRRLLVLLLCLAPLLVRGEPQVRVETRMVPATPAKVGDRLRLEVDLLVDTWFTAPPQLPALELPGAQVMPPVSEPPLLSVQRDGRPFFGVRYVYRIMPSEARRFEVPALSIRVSPGQAAQPVTVRSQPLGFVVAALPAGEAAGKRLVAKSLIVVQRLVRSRETLQVGDSLTRELQIDVGDALALQIPPPELAEVDGLRRYLKAPQLTSLDDGRGGVSGGRRVDRVSYVAQRPGHFRLPAIELHWWDATNGAERRASVPAVEFEVGEAAAERAPFPLAEDLRRLGQRSKLFIAWHWLLLSALVPLGGMLLVCARPLARRLLAAWTRWRAARRGVWLTSAEYAWRQLPLQLGQRPAQLGALYLWVRRSTGETGLRPLARRLSEQSAQCLRRVLQACYGREGSDDAALAQLSRVLPALRHDLLRQRPMPAPRYALKSLNQQQPLPDMAKAWNEGVP